MWIFQQKKRTQDLIMCRCYSQADNTYWCNEYMVNKKKGIDMKMWTDSEGRYESA